MEAFFVIACVWFSKAPIPMAFKWLV